MTIQAKMTFTQLLLFLQNILQRPILIDSPSHTLDLIASEKHPDEMLGEMLKLMLDWCRITDAEQPVERAALINALGPMRLKLMGDDGDIHAYRLIGQLIAAVDEAFDLEASKPDPSELH